MVILLIDIIQESDLRLDTTLPVAISLISKEINSTAISSSNLKRSCLRRLRAGNDLHQRIDHLYSFSVDSLGPFCDRLGIGKKWLGDAHQQTLSSGTTICNGVVLELYQYLKKHTNISSMWTEAQRWVSRLYPDITDAPLTQTLCVDWMRLQNKRATISKKNKDAFLEAEYKLPQTQTAPHEHESESNPSVSDQPDMFHTDYNSPIKRQLVEHIVRQDETISQKQQVIEELTKCMDEKQSVLSQVDIPKIRKNNLKRKLLDQAGDEHAKKVKTLCDNSFPGDEIIGRVIKHKYELPRNNGRNETKWFKGTVLRKARQEELVDASADDLEAHKQGCTIYLVHYEKYEHPEPIALQRDWENGDIKIDV